MFLITASYSKRNPGILNKEFLCPHCCKELTAIFSCSRHCDACGRSLPNVIAMFEHDKQYLLKWHCANDNTRIV